MDWRTVLLRSSSRKFCSFIMCISQKINFLMPIKVGLFETYPKPDIFTLTLPPFFHVDAIMIQNTPSKINHLS